jgi:DNA-binding MarR family transcriptional regulator
MISTPTTIQMAGSGAGRVADVRPDLSEGIALIAALAAVGIRVTEIMATTVSDPAVLTNANLDVLVHLYAQGPMRPSDIAARLNLPRPKTTKILNDLEAAHLVKRHRGTTADRRVVTTTITVAGQEVLDAADRALRDGFDDPAALNRDLHRFLERTAQRFDP